MNAHLIRNTKIIDGQPFKGQHCETTATGTLLKQMDINLSEPLLFGIGEGLSFIFWNMKTMDFPFIGGRIKTDLITKNIANNLNLSLIVKETSSKKKAWQEVKHLLDQDKMVGLKLDCFHLEYFSNPFHFAGHYVAIYGYDDQFAYLVDTIPQGSKVQTSLDTLEKARAEKGPMSSRNLYYYFEKNNQKVNIINAIITAIRSNAKQYLAPPINNISYKGIKKTSKEIKNWFAKSSNIKDEFSSSAMMMEKAGTGGALFRNLYRDFLNESFELTQNPILNEAHQSFIEIASLWTNISELFLSVSETQKESLIDEAAEILLIIAEKEYEVFNRLQHI